MLDATPSNNWWFKDHHDACSLPQGDTAQKDYKKLHVALE